MFLLGFTFNQPSWIGIRILGKAYPQTFLNAVRTYLMPNLLVILVLMHVLAWVNPFVTADMGVLVLGSHDSTCMRLRY